MFAKIKNKYLIEKAPRCIHIGNETFVLPTEEQYNRAGYYEFIEGKEPEERKWYKTISIYTLKDNKIIQTFEYWKELKPDYSKLVVSHIRDKYSLNDELAILRQGLSGAKKGDFDEYNSFCESCKSNAIKELEEWEKA